MGILRESVQRFKWNSELLTKELIIYIRLFWKHKKRICNNRYVSKASSWKLSVERGVFGWYKSFRLRSKVLRLEGNERRQLFTETEATRLVYVRNNETNEFYDINRNYSSKPFTLHECHVGIGYQKIISHYKGITAEYIITVPTQGHAELWRIKLINTEERDRDISVVSYSRPDANVT